MSIAWPRESATIMRAPLGIRLMIELLCFDVLNVYQSWVVFGGASGIGLSGRLAGSGWDGRSDELSQSGF